MREFPTEEQANLFVLILSVSVPFLSLAYGALQSGKVSKDEKKVLWINTAVCALLGPILWCFWLVYNSIEDHYGLDSLKALKINFCIAIALGGLFFALFRYAPRLAGIKPSPRKK